ncbi:protein PFF0380w-like [Rhopalosiphum padi]|uniref:protein PFF0380w-like n=1 Tax=Rhopalosiphum padi TaxID=40932 RepID=UPI00298E2EF6|nr:protein PFF0380w-like [Rhopalosiphum padi]XP_060836630.1 protein PFF0380w-like [Rhopalosiphum padi]XP_060836631.1 protein PFF0380w-like [Rhopalosiphum padi]XP_060836632.1 protein PFF0380w-like [Rhopalosiphum padi]XP_060836633.1 protein PFF0380w-like [Rhopalosiphum padi]XP_060836635.1 protein PFF0380w-like [Rhopalosiphum padi]
MQKKVKFIELKKINNSNDVHNESFENKNPKKKKHGQISTVLNTHTKENTCEKDIEQNIHGFSEILSTKKKSINASENMSKKYNYCIHNEIDEMKNLSKKKKYIKSLNLIESNSNNYARNKMFEKTNEEFNEQNIIGSDSRNNVSQKKKSEINALADNNCSVDNENIQIKKPKKKNKYVKGLNSKELNSYHDIENKTCEEVCEQNINDTDSWENLNQTIKSELNTIANISLENNFKIDNDNVTTKKLKKKKKHNKSLNLIELSTNNDTEIESFGVSCEEFNYQSKNDSSFTENISQKTNPSPDISLKNNSSIDNENIETKKLKKKKKHNKSLNLIELSTNNDTEIESFGVSCEEFNYQSKNDSSFTENISQKTNPSPDISLKNNSSIDNENIETKKLKKKKKHNKSLNLIELSTNNDTEIKSFGVSREEFNYQSKNDSSFTENISQKTNPSPDISLKNNSSIDNENIETKKLKKKKKHNKSLNLIELSTNNDTEIEAFEKTCEEVNEQSINDSYYWKNKSLKKKNEMNALADIENVPTKKRRKKKNQDTENTTLEVVSEQNIDDSEFMENLNQTIKSEINTSSDFSLLNNCNLENENVQPKTLKRKKKHNESLNLLELSINNDIKNKPFKKTCEEVNKQSFNDSNFRKSISQKINCSSDIPLENNFSADIENVDTKTLKIKKKHNKSLNLIELSTNNNTEIEAFEKTWEENNEQSINDSYYWKNKSQKRKNEINALADIENVPTKKRKKKKNQDTEYTTLEVVSEQNIDDSKLMDNLNQTIKSEINTSSDISLLNNCSLENENVRTKTLKRKKKHNENLNPLEFSTNNNREIDTIKRITLRSDEKILDSDINIPMCNSKKSKIHIVSTSDIIKATDYNYSVTKNKNNVSMTSEKYNNITDQKISQNNCNLKTLLKSMESNNFEDATDSSTKIESKFNLMTYLKNKDPSIRNHPKYKQIIEILSKKIKNALNKSHQITDSDVVLLKTVGSIILEKIVEKMNFAQDINDLEITLPIECNENKLHFIETTLSRPPCKEKMNIIKKLNPQVKLRVFNSEEDNMIREYWSKFQKEYNISNILPFISNGLEMALNKSVRFQFIRYISAGLPNRLLSSVYNRFNILFNEYQDKTRFSEEEDQLIMKVEKCDAISNKFSVLSLILNRSRLQLYRRHGVLKNQYEKCKKIFWDDQKRQELFTNILLETNTDNWKDLKNLTLKKNTLIKIAKNLGDDVTYTKVRNQWNYLYTMLFCEKPIKMLTLRLNILELLEQQNPKHFSDVDWKEITNQLYPGANSKLICSFFHSWYDKIVPSDIKKSIKDTLFYLRKHKVEKIRKEISERGEREFPRRTVQDYDLLVNNNE